MQQKSPDSIIAKHKHSAYGVVFEHHASGACFAGFIFETLVLSEVFHEAA